MIEGIVTAEREPIVEIVAKASDGKDYPFNAVVDTGFTGWLTLNECNSG